MLLRILLSIKVRCGRIMMIKKLIMEDPEHRSFNSGTAIISQTLFSHNRKYLNQKLFKHDQVYELL